MAVGMVDGKNDNIIVTSIAKRFDEDTLAVQLNGTNFMQYLQANIQDYELSAKLYI